MDANNDASGSNEAVVKSDSADYRLQVHLIRGSGLVVRDSSGSSDPYVVFRQADKQLGRSRVIRQCLEPVWDQDFELKLDSLVGDLELRVYDWDALSRRDDYMGRCLLPLAVLSPGQQHSLRLPLTDETGEAKEASMGDLQFTVELRLPTAAAEPELAPQSESVVAVGLIDIIGLRSFALDKEDASQISSRALYAQLQLGDQICRSRFTRRGHCWDEEIRMAVPPEPIGETQPKQHQLNLCVFERHLTSQDILIGRARIPLPASSSAWGGDLIVAPLSDYPTGGPAVRLIIDLLVPASSDGQEESERIEDCDEGFKGDCGIGYLGVRILATDRLKSGGGANASGIFCTMRLNNSQLSTHVIDSEAAMNATSGRRRHCRELKFRVRDLHSELELSVYTESKRQSPPTLLGRLALRLPQLLKSADAQGKQVGWYGLRDKRLEAWTGGQLKLETRLRYSWLSAAVRTIGPKEQRLWGLPESKLRLRLVRRDTRRCVTAIETISRLGAFASSCFHWDDPVRSATALACYVAIVWNLQPFMLPLAPLILLLISLSSQYAGSQSVRKLSVSGGSSLSVDKSTADSDDEAEMDERSWLQRARAAQEVLLRLQDGLDVAASCAERLRNLGQWREPRITFLVVVLLAGAALALGLLPLRLLALAWGVNKFSKRLLRPGADDSNELLNLLARVPSDVDLERTRLMPPR